MDQITEKLTCRVSINIITYNQATFIARAIKSVLAQSFFDWEIIIIDDASSDRTEEIIKPYLVDKRIHYFKNEKNSGICLSRNRALQESGGEYIAILDSDDFWNDPDKLKKQLRFLDDNTDYVIIGTGVIVIDEDNNKIKQYSNPLKNTEIKNQILKKNPFANSSVMYRRAPVMEVGAYNLDINGIEDYDLWLRLGKKYKMANLPDFCLSYRVHGNNITSTNRERLMELNLKLISEHRHDYPGYFYAKLRRQLRLRIFKLLKFLSSQS